MIFAKILRNAAAEKLAKTVTKNNLRVGKYVARYLPRLEIQQKFALVCQVSISETCSYILRHCVVNTAIILITNITTIIIIVLIIITNITIILMCIAIPCTPVSLQIRLLKSV